MAPLRSVLYSPGANQRAMEKTRELAADAIVFDLEDAVAPDAKETARAAVLAQLTAGGFGQRRLVVRCNALETPWGEADIRALVSTPLKVLCLPKVETLAQLLAVKSLLDELGRGDMELWPMIETPIGVKNVDQIVAFESVATLIMGTTDLASELRIPHRPDRLGLLYSLGRCVLAARCHGKSILDGVYLDIRDDPGFDEVCVQGAALGFDGKTLIHPGQIAAANDIFGFSEEQVAHARALLAVWEEAQASGKGVAVLDGKLVEVMHVGEATRLLEQAEWISRAEEAATS